MVFGIPTDQLNYWGIFVGYLIFTVIAITLFLNSDGKCELTKFLIGMFAYICIFSMIDMIRVYTRWKYDTLKFMNTPYTKTD